MRVHVFIGTTQGPVAVQSVTEEDPDVQSVVCIDGGIEPLPISARYHDFVRKGTGIIHKDFGCPAYRVDLAGRVDQGNSWQLPLYIAHYLHRAGCLGNGRPEPGDKVVWATGTVKADKSITAVEQVPVKLGQSIDLLHSTQEKKCDVLFLIPQSNLADLDKKGDDTTTLNFFTGQRRQQGVADLEAAKACVENFIQSQDEDTPSATDLGQNAAKPGKLRYWLTLLVLFVLAGAGYQSAISLGWLPLALNDDRVSRDAQSPIPPSERPTAPQTRAGVDPGGSPGKKQAAAGSDASADMSQTRLVVTLSEAADDCDNYTTERELSADNGNFPAVPIEKLCAIRIKPATGVSAVIGVSLDNGAILPVRRVSGAWHIAKPNLTDRSREYVLLVLRDLDQDEARTELAAAVAKMRYPSGGSISVRQIQGFIASQGWDSRLYRQLLQYSEDDAAYSGRGKFYDY